LFQGRLFHHTCVSYYKAFMRADRLLTETVRSSHSVAVLSLRNAHSQSHSPSINSGGGVAATTTAKRASVDPSCNPRRVMRSSMVHLHDNETVNWRKSY
jgi:hypothetical protein